MLQSLSLVDLLVVILATYATAHYVTREDGPFAVFLRLRKWAGAEVAADDVAALGDEAAHTETHERSGSLAQLLSCPYCLSPYAAVAALLLLLFLWPVAVALAAAGGSVFLLELTR